MKYTWITVLFFFISCGPSAEDIREDWSSYVGQHNSCTKDDECAVVTPGCPLSCEEAVSKKDQSAASEYAKKLIEDYESSGVSCSNDCVSLAKAKCVKDVCVLPK